MDSYVTAAMSASAVRTNLRLLRGQLGANTRLCAAVKADCYGHGLELLLSVITPLADAVAVAAPEEAVTVRQLGCSLPVLTFFSACAYATEPKRDEAIEELIRYEVIQTIVSPEEVPLIARVARRRGMLAEVHVKVDTGMGRSGVIARQAAALVQQAADEPGLKLTGLYSHFATADEEDRSFARHQLDTFREVLAACSGAKGLVRHMANSAATIDLPDAHFDMVRPGLSIYGYQPSDYLVNHLPLRPALRLTAPLMPIKDLPEGTCCGYGLTHRFERPSRIGRVAIGYGDGYLRRLSNVSSASIRGIEAPIRGRVSMDQLILDVTDVPDARLGDEVELISPDPAAPWSVENLARLAGTIPYEITCALGGRIRRVLVE
jgi:alanine racemase